MSDFLIQKDEHTLTNEANFLIQELDRFQLMHSYKRCTLADISQTMPNLNPVGSIEFVTGYLHHHYGFEKENPIEIPKYLRTDEFLKRDYKIVPWNQLPTHGKWFIKDVSELKKFGQCVQADFFVSKDLFIPNPGNDYSLTLSKEHLYQVSSLFHTKSEYRVYVMQGEIEVIAHYDGDCTIFPDVNLIKKTVGLINLNERWLKSYTIDVMCNQKETALIEVHNFASVGLYSSLWGNSLPFAYRDGIDYLLNDNKEIER